MNKTVRKMVFTVLILGACVLLPHYYLFESLILVGALISFVLILFLVYVVTEEDEGDKNE